jgi:valyl-tRNA synthetase
MMQGLHFMGEVPFRTVYIHALVRDERGQKMSKSRGNIIDPLELIDRYGCDALRFTLAALASPGRDIKLAESRVESSRNFATKLWNAARYTGMSGCALAPDFDPRGCRLTVNRWIAGATRDCAAAVTNALEAFRFDEAAHHLYHFLWGNFCDWYLEFSKPILQGPLPHPPPQAGEGRVGGDDAGARGETQATTAWVLAQTLHLLHPLMPFITEELWQHLAGAEAGMLIRAPWPDLAPDLHDPEAAAEMEWVVAAISAIRTIRTEVNVPAGARLPLLVKDADATAAARLERHREHFLRLARVDGIETVDSVPAGGAAAIVEGTTLILRIGDVIDLDRERARLFKEITRLDGDLAKFAGKLTNPSFLAKAKAEVIDEQREREADARRDRDRLRAVYDRIAAG